MKAGVTLLIVAGAIVIFLLTDRIPQDPAYHQFVDTRSFLGLPNALNVLTNLPFLIAGAWGLFLATNKALSGRLRPAWIGFFAGIVLTALGSGWYHASPDNDSLFWDRAAMTIALMSMLSLLLGEYFSVRLARIALAPMLLVGAATVLWWSYTESAGAGDLRLYALIVVAPLALIPVLLVARDRGHDMTGPMWLLSISYLSAKVFEHFDAEVYAFGNVISGHGLKHLAAAMVPIALLYVLRNRARSAAAPDNLVH